MSQMATIEAVRKSIVVEVPPERAFEVFTAQQGTWWPSDHHIGEAEFGDAVLEPREGGRWYEVGVDGSQCEWGRVLAYEPPHRVVVTWQLDGDFRYDPDPAHASEVEVRFTPEGPSSTRVDLEHRNIERHGPGGEKIRAAVDSPGGWGMTLERLAEAVRG